MSTYQQMQQLQKRHWNTFSEILNHMRLFLLSGSESFVFTCARLSSPAFMCAYFYLFMPTYVSVCSPTLTNPHLPSPTLTYPHLPSPKLTYPHLPSPTLTYPHLPSPTLTYPHLRSPEHHPSTRITNLCCSGTSQGVKRLLLTFS